MLLGHTFAERLNVKIIKITDQLKFERSESDKITINCVNEEILKMGEYKIIQVMTNDKRECSVYVKV